MRPTSFELRFGKWAFIVMTPFPQGSRPMNVLQQRVAHGSPFLVRVWLALRGCGCGPWEARQNPAPYARPTTVARRARRSL